MEQLPSPPPKNTIYGGFIVIFGLKQPTFISNVCRTKYFDIRHEFFAESWAFWLFFWHSVRHLILKAERFAYGFTGTFI
jgi:hypothetical protein